MFTTTSWAARPVAAPTDTDTTEANITLVTLGFLERSQLAHRPLDAQLAGKFFDRYLDDLDGSRSLLLQSDVNEFAAYRATLAQAIHKNGDTSAAHAIFSRYLKRLAQRAAYVSALLRSMKFDFTEHDIYIFDRAHAQRPSDLDAARRIWRQEMRAEYLQEKLADKVPEQIARTLIRRKERQLSIMKALRPDEVLEIYLNALAHVYDPHSDYLGQAQMESLSIAMNLSLFGIGVSVETYDGYCQIHKLLPGGPALRSGQLKPGDRIVGIAQAGGDPIDIRNIPPSRAGELMRGPKGTTVSLTILPGGAAGGAMPKTVSLVRDEVKLEDQQAKARIFDLPIEHGQTLRLGVVDLPSFYVDMGDRNSGEHRSATADVTTLLSKLKKEHVRGVILDLRDNGGGSLEQAISLTGLFIGQGPVVQARDFAGEIEVGLDADSAVQYDGPLVLLTNRFSASASEIVAGALQDYGRALVVGDASTFGKGTVQAILPLAPVMDDASFTHSYDPGALKVTISKLYRPNGASTQLRGVAPDIVLPSPSELSDVNESALKAPLAWDAVPAVPHEQLNRVQPYLSNLRERSHRRVAAEKEFTYLASDIDWLKKNMPKQSISLNEAERRQELAELKARQDERRQDAPAHDSFQPTIYEVTLNNPSWPHFPTPLAPEEREKESSDGTPDTKASSTPGDLDRVAIGQSPDSDILLYETVKILADYVDLLASQSQQPRLAGQRQSSPAF